MRWNDKELEKVKEELEKKFEDLIKAKYGVDVSKNATMTMIFVPMKNL